MEILQGSGEMVFRRPNAFNLDDPEGYFQSELVRKMIDGKELNSG